MGRLPRSRLLSLGGWLCVGASGCGYVPNPLLELATDTDTDTDTETDTDTSEGWADTDRADSDDWEPDTEEGDETPDCPLGTLGCPCANRVECEEGLVCEEGLCVDPVSCGDGVVGGDEECDDGNETSADGCEPDCVRTRVVEVEAGYYHTCIATERGAVICWGRNNEGALGYGHTETIGDNELATSEGPVALPGPVVDLACGGWHSCAALESGAVVCWGRNSSGQLGVGHLEDIGDDGNDDFVVLEFEQPVVEVAAGRNFSCARGEGGSVYCWGKNSDGQLGRGDTQDVGGIEIADAENSSAFVGLSRGIAVGGYHACSLVFEGGLRCWGRGTTGQLGYGNDAAVGDTELPTSVVPILAGPELSHVQVGVYHSAVIVLGDMGAQVYSWGDGSFGQMGNGSSVDVGGLDEAPHVVAQLGATPVALVAGSFHSCALLEGGDVLCWGANNLGRLGLGVAWDVGAEDLPLSYEPLSFASPAVQLSAGHDHSCALLESGELRCWGSNTSGQLGLGYVTTIGDDERADDDGLDPVPLFE